MAAPLGHVVDAHAIAVYRCDETHAGDSLLDVSGNGINLASQAANNTPLAGQIGGARSYPFDGVNEASFAVSAEAVRLRMMSSWTYERWLYLRSDTWATYTAHTLLSLDAAGHVPTALLNIDTSTRKLHYLYETGSLDSFAVQDIVSSGVVPLDAWIHVAIERDGSTVNFYLNGVSIGRTTGTANPNGGASSPTLRDGIAANGYPFRGYGDDWRLSDVARGASGVLDSYHRGIGYDGTPLPLVTRDIPALAAGTDLLWDFTNDCLARAPNGDLLLARGTDSVLQDITFSLQVILGEYAFDATAGVPWFDGILGKSASANTIGAVLRAAIASRPHVSRVTSFAMDLDAPARRLTVNFSATTDVGVIGETSLTLAV